MSFQLYFSGAEVTEHRETLTNQGVKHMSVSFTGVLKRPKLLADFSKVFAPDISIFLDSGAYSLNALDKEGKPKHSYTHHQLIEMSEAYIRLVDDNIDRLDMFSEFDALALGPQWIKDMRIGIWGEYPREKFLPIWHAEDGVKALEALAAEYPRVGIMETDLNGRNLAPTLNRLASRGTKLHAMATKIDELREIRWSSAASTSWLSPVQWGDTIVWTGRELKRYPKRYKKQARDTHRTLFAREGFNVEAIDNDDPAELLKLSIWGWLRFEEDIVKHEVTTSPNMAISTNAQTDLSPVATSPVETLNPVAPRPRAREHVELLPILGVRTESNEDGEQVSSTFMRSNSTRPCDTCYLADRCPAFLPGSLCAFSIPVEVRTRQDIRDISNALVEMQTQRVWIMRYFEEQSGGNADPNLSREIDRLNKLIVARDEMEKEGFSINIQARAQGSAGTISRLFGSEAGKAAMALPNVIDADVVARQITG